MKKVMVVYVSNTGNTSSMVDELEKHFENADIDYTILEAADAEASLVLDNDVIVLACPACGVEELDEESMEPLMQALEPELRGRKIALLGSYDWGGGEFMDNWRERVEEAGGELISEPVIAEGDASSVIDELEELAKKIIG